MSKEAESLTLKVLLGIFSIGEFSAILGSNSDSTTKLINLGLTAAIIYLLFTLYNLGGLILP